MSGLLQKYHTPSQARRSGAMGESWNYQGCSISVEPGEALAVPGCVAPHLLEHARALEVEAGIVLVGHADAAVELDHLPADQMERLIGDRFGKTGLLADVRSPGIRRLQRPFDRRIQLPRIRTASTGPSPASAFRGFSG